VIKINTAHSEQSIRIGFTDQRLTAYGGLACWSAFLCKRKVRAELASFLPQAPTSPNAYEPTDVALGLMGGIICGAAFGFLGFALFLLGAKGDMDAAFQDSQHKVQLERMAPGSFVIFIAAILIGVCSIHPVKLEFFPAVDPSLPISNRAGTLLDSGSNANNDPTQDPNVMPNSGSNGSAGDAFHGGLTTTIPDPKTKGKGK